MKSNTLPVNVSQIQLWFVTSPLATQASVQQAQLDGMVTCVAATTSSQPVPGCSTSSFAGKPMPSSPAVCRSLQSFQSKCAVSPASRTPSVCAAAQSQVNQLPNSSALQSSSESPSTPANSSRSLQHTKSLPVPMSAVPPSTCIRPKVLSPNPQTSPAVTCTTLTSGIRPVRPSQPLPPVRTSSCPTKVIPCSKQPDEVYEEVPMHEPDLNRQPSRSALKGSKSTGAQSFQQQLEKALSLTQRLAGCRPFPTDPVSDTVISMGLSRSKSGDCAKSASKSLPAVPPKPRLMWVCWHWCYLYSLYKSSQHPLHCSTFLIFDSVTALCHYQGSENPRIF